MPRRHGTLWGMTLTTTPGPDGASGRREHEPFEAFFLRTRDRVLRSAQAVAGGDHDVEDAVAEAFARALARWADVSAHPAPGAWVMRTAVNLLRDRHRSRVRSLRILPRMAADQVVAAPAAPVDPTVLAAIRRLPERQREVLALRVLMDLSAESTAQALGISAQSVGTHLHRALATLRRTLSPADVVPPISHDRPPTPEGETTT